MMKTSTSGLTPSAPPKLDLNAVLDCSFGNYPWDGWARHALARGVPEDLAGLGRLLIREAYQHDWPDELKALCGWSDDLSAEQAGGQALFAFALRAPKAARRQWDILMRTDGLRGDYPSPSGDWTWGFLRADARRLLSTLNSRN